MKIHQVAAQLYTLRDHCRTSAELAQSLRRLRAIGYTAAQVSGVGPIPAAEIRTIFAGEGIEICATHESGAQILAEPEKVIERLQTLGCTLTAYPFPAGLDLTDVAQLDPLIAGLERSGARLRAAGLTLGYHNHAIEFCKVGGKTVLEHIYSRTSPRNLVGEIDTYWIHYGGGDVIDWCRRLRGRLPFVHLKDYKFQPSNLPTWCELGAGTLPLREIIAEAEASGCEWFIVEQDTCPGDPFESLAQSFRHLQTLVS